MNLDAAPQALEESVAGVVALDDDGRAIGMGRVVGDGAMYSYVQDVVVAPEYQRRGIGTEMLRVLIDRIPDGSFVVTLIESSAGPALERAMVTMVFDWPAELERLVPQ